MLICYNETLPHYLIRPLDRKCFKRLCLFRAQIESNSGVSALHNAITGSQLLYRVLRVSENVTRRQSSLQTTGRGVACLHHTRGCCN